MSEETAEHRIVWCLIHEVCVICSSEDHRDCPVERPEGEEGEP